MSFSTRESWRTPPGLEGRELRPTGQWQRVAFSCAVENGTHTTTQRTSASGQCQRIARVCAPKIVTNSIAMTPCSEPTFFPYTNIIHVESLRAYLNSDCSQVGLRERR